MKRAAAKLWELAATSHWAAVPLSFTFGPAVYFSVKLLLFAAGLPHAEYGDPASAYAKRSVWYDGRDAPGLLQALGLLACMVLTGVLVGRLLARNRWLRKPHPVVFGDWFLPCVALLVLPMPLYIALHSSSSDYFDAGGYSAKTVYRSKFWVDFNTPPGPKQQVISGAGSELGAPGSR